MIFTAWWLVIRLIFLLKYVRKMCSFVENGMYMFEILQSSHHIWLYYLFDIIFKHVPAPQKCDQIFFCPSTCFVQKCDGMEMMLARLHQKYFAVLFVLNTCFMSFLSLMPPLSLHCLWFFWDGNSSRKTVKNSHSKQRRCWLITLWKFVLIETVPPHCEIVEQNQHYHRTVYC